MSDDAPNTGEPDRSRVPSPEPYGVDDVAEKHDLTPEQVRDLIQQVGNDPNAVDQAAERLKGR